MDEKELHDDYCLQVSTLFVDLQTSLESIQQNSSDAVALASLHRAAHTLKTDAKLMKETELAAEAARLEGLCEAFMETNLSISQSEIELLTSAVATIVTMDRQVDCG